MLVARRKKKKENEDEEEMLVGHARNGEVGRGGTKVEVVDVGTCKHENREIAKHMVDEDRKRRRGWKGLGREKT